MAAAYIQWGTVGLPALPPGAALTSAGAVAPYGFPAWLRITHFVNFLFLSLLIRSGLQILMDHPRLYWNVHCTPGAEWLRLTPVEVPNNRVWTAKDDSRHLSPWIGLPGYRHTVGMARHWHFLSVLFWVGSGVLFVGGPRILRRAGRHLIAWGVGEARIPDPERQDAASGDAQGFGDSPAALRVQRAMRCC